MKWVIRNCRTAREGVALGGIKFLGKNDAAYGQLCFMPSEYNAFAFATKDDARRFCSWLYEQAWVWGDEKRQYDYVPVPLKTARVERAA